MAESKQSTDTKTKTDEEVKEKSKKPKSRKGWLWIMLGIALTAIILAAYFLFFRNVKVADDPKNSPSYSDSFFIYSGGKYSLWNKEGMRLNADEFDSASEIIGDYAYVKKGSEYAILNGSGRVTVPFGQISRVVKSYAGLFLIEDNSGARRLITGTNRELLAGEDLEIEAPSLKSGFLVAELANHYYVYNYTGKLVIDFDKVDDGELEYDGENDFAMIYYNESNLLFDVRSGEQLAMFSGIRFEIEDVTKDRGLILLADYEDGDLHKLVKGRAIYDLTETKNYGFVRNTSILVGYDDYDEIAVLDDNYKVAKKVKADLALKDLSNYATLDENNRVVIYHNGNLVKTFEDGSELVSGVLFGADLYAIKANDKYGFYRLDGSYAFGEYENVYGVYNLFHRTSVSEDGVNYYMIDADGKRMSDVTYTRIYTYDNSYLVKNSDGMYALLDANGVPITGFDYEDGYNRSVALGREVFQMERGSGSYDVFDAMVQGNKLIASDVNTSAFHQNYFTVKNGDGKLEFYTYTGYKFYTEE